MLCCTCGGQREPPVKLYSRTCISKWTDGGGGDGRIATKVEENTMGIACFPEADTCVRRDRAFKVRTW